MNVYMLVVCVLLKNKFLYSCSIVFSWYCTLSFLFKTTFQLSRHNHNSQIKPPMTYLKFLCRSHLLFFLLHSPSFTILRSPPSIHTSTAVPPFNPQPNHSPTLNCFKTDNCCPNHRCHCTRRSNSKACTGGSIFSPPPAQQCP